MLSVLECDHLYILICLYNQLLLYMLAQALCTLLCMQTVTKILVPVMLRDFILSSANIKLKSVSGNSSMESTKNITLYIKVN